ncbi:MAG TPA: ABC transporter ATP-binding protein [Pseudonocardia sp.]|uniref:ABC transporter ATP-binding protein n=1 Tax=Pseudonocardia sp. TaxID=60912 RepID=UPI002C09DB8E|nr:ABC transporter ATP-binding protein [Pseudonocardia sp.]HTF53438.1 ABC transporter ATP-binding protein [Pseudonocardia sp.]
MNQPSSQPTSDSTTADAVLLDRIDLDYRQGRTSTPALRDVTIRIKAGQTLALLGPSGSGKSTALKVLAGFLQPTAGRVYLDGRDVTDLPPARRGIGVVVQSYALFPHLRVDDNVAFGLRARRLPKDVIIERVAEALGQVGMSEYGRRLPRELSGGQQQRVAIARALAIRPKVLLLDEPLAALDIHLRQGMLAELQRLRANLPDTAILFVTHDQAEALALADQIGVMRAGRLVDPADTDELWHRPPSRFTASFLGGANLIPVTIAATPDESSAVVKVAEAKFVADRAVDWSPGAPAVLAVRPHALRLTSSLDGPDVLPAKVTSAQWRGPATRVTIAVDALPDLLVEIDEPGVIQHQVGDRVGVHIPPHSGVLVPADRPEPDSTTPSGASSGAGTQAGARAGAAVSAVRTAPAPLENTP